MHMPIKIWEIYRHNSDWTLGVLKLFLVWIETSFHTRPPPGGGDKSSGKIKHPGVICPEDFIFRQVATL